MDFGKLKFKLALNHLDLVAEPTKAHITSVSLADVLVSPIDDRFSDTAAFCDNYEIGPNKTANCVIVEAKRGERTWHAACVILATTKADVNGIVRRHLDARKISFAPMDTAVSLTSMEYGGITPIGLPDGWPILVDTQVAEAQYVVIGSGIRGSKLLVPGTFFRTLAGAVVADITKPGEV